MFRRLIISGLFLLCASASFGAYQYETFRYQTNSFKLEYESPFDKYYKYITLAQSNVILADIERNLSHSDLTSLQQIYSAIKRAGELSMTNISPMLPSIMQMCNPALNQQGNVSQKDLAKRRFILHATIWVYGRIGVDKDIVDLVKWYPSITEPATKRFFLYSLTMVSKSDAALNYLIKISEEPMQEYLAKQLLDGLLIHHKKKAVNCLLHLKERAEFSPEYRDSVQFVLDELLMHGEE